MNGRGERRLRVAARDRHDELVARDLGEAAQNCTRAWAYAAEDVVEDLARVYAERAVVAKIIARRLRFLLRRRLAGEGRSPERREVDADEAARRVDDHARRPLPTVVHLAGSHVQAALLDMPPKADDLSVCGGQVLHRGHALPSQPHVSLRLRLVSRCDDQPVAFELVASRKLEAAHARADPFLSLEVDTTVGESFVASPEPAVVGEDAPRIGRRGARGTAARSTEELEHVAGAVEDEQA